MPDTQLFSAFTLLTIAIAYSHVSEMYNADNKTKSLARTLYCSIAFIGGAILFSTRGIERPHGFDIIAALFFGCITAIVTYAIIILWSIMFRHVKR